MRGQHGAPLEGGQVQVQGQQGAEHDGGGGEGQEGVVQVPQVQGLVDEGEVRGGPVGEDEQQEGCGGKERVGWGGKRGRAGGKRGEVGGVGGGALGKAWRWWWRALSVSHPCHHTHVGVGFHFDLWRSV